MKIGKWIVRNKIIVLLLVLLLAASAGAVVLLTSKNNDKPVESTNTEPKKVSIDFEDGKYDFIGIDKRINSDADESLFSVEDYNGSKALKCTTDGKAPYVGIQVDALLGDSLSKLRTIELDIGIENPDGTFYSASGSVYALLGEDKGKDSVVWSVYKEDGNPKTVTYAVPDGKDFVPGNYIVISMETDVGKDKGETAANLYIDNIAFKDVDGNVLKADTSATFGKQTVVEDRNNLWDLTDIVEFEGFAVSAGGWEQNGKVMPQEIIDALVPGSVVEIAFQSDSNEMWLVIPDGAKGFQRVGCWYTDNGTSYYNDARTIAQIPFELIAKYCGEEVSQWGAKMQCESAKDWSVRSLKVGQRVEGTGPSLYILKDRVYVPGVEDMQPITEAYGVTGIHFSKQILEQLKKGGVIEVTYEKDAEDTLLWFAGAGAEDADGDGEKDWQMIGGPKNHGTEHEVKRNFEGTVVQITYETLTKYYGEGWADSENGFWFMVQASGSCRVKSIQIGTIGTGEDTWLDVAATLPPLYVLKDRIYVDGVENMETISKEYGVTGISLSKKMLQKLKDGGAIEVTYETDKKGTLVWFAGAGAEDKDGDGEKDWQMLGGPSGPAMEADVRRNAAGTIMQVTYETLSKYLDKGWADGDGYWFMIQATGNCKIKSIQIGKVGTGRDTWLSIEEQLSPLYVLKDRVYVSGVEYMTPITPDSTVAGLSLNKEMLAKLKDGGAVEVCYEPGKTGTILWFSGAGAEDADGDGEKDWQMIGGPKGSVTEDEVRRSADGTIVQISYETLTKYYGDGWADGDGYWFMVQSFENCIIKNIQIGKIGTGDNTWAPIKPEEPENPEQPEEPENPEQPEVPGDGNAEEDRTNLYTLTDILDVTNFTQTIDSAYGLGRFALTADMVAKLQAGAVIEIAYECTAEPWMGNKTLWFAGNGTNGWLMLGFPGDAADAVGKEELKWNNSGNIVQITYETLNAYLANGWNTEGNEIIYQSGGVCTIQSIKIGMQEAMASEDRTNLYTLTGIVDVTGFEAAIDSAFGTGGFSVTADLAAKLQAGAVIEIAYECNVPEGSEWMGTKSLWFAGNDASSTWQMIGYPGDGGIAQDDLKWNNTGTIVQVTYETLNAYLASGWNTEGGWITYQSGGSCSIKSVKIGMREITPQQPTEDRTNLYTLTDTVDITEFESAITSAFGTGGFSVTANMAAKLQAGAVIEIAYECNVPEGSEWMGTKSLWFAGNDASSTWQMIGYPGDGGIAQDELKWNGTGTIVQVTYETLNAYLASGWNANGGWITYQSGGPCTIQSIKIGRKVVTTP